MVRVSQSRRWWLSALAAIVVTGILSRVVRTGSILFDKYLGDALYAAMIYAIFRLFSTSRYVAVYSFAAVFAIELFQLTMIPARLFASEHLWVRLIARLLGTHFSWLDVLAYAAGIAGMRVALDRPPGLDSASPAPRRSRRPGART